MTRLALFLLLLPAGAAARAQSSHDSSRGNRVVLYSPHFDVVPEPHGGLSCPAQPLRLYGFETRDRRADAALLVRLLLPADAFSGKPPVVIPGEPVRLSRRWVGGGFVALPEAPGWTVRTDSSGGAVLRVPPGVYELAIDVGQPIGRGVIQVRPRASDSLHVYIVPRKLC